MRVEGLTMRWSERRTAVRPIFKMTSSVLPRATRDDSALPSLTVSTARVYVAPLPAGSIPASRRSSCSR